MSTLTRHADMVVARAHRKTQRNGARERQLKRARAYLKAKYFEPITLLNVASFACMSVHHFSRHYQGMFGKSAHREIIELRLALAEYLLSETSLSVSQVAKSVGFECRTTLFRQFKRELGKSPNAVRAEQRRLQRKLRQTTHQKRAASLLAPT